MAYWMVACSVYLYIAILGAKVRICRDEGRPSTTACLRTGHLHGAHAPLGRATGAPNSAFRTPCPVRNIRRGHPPW